MIELELNHRHSESKFQINLRRIKEDIDALASNAENECMEESIDIDKVKYRTYIKDALLNYGDIITNRKTFTHS